MEGLDPDIGTDSESLPATLAAFAAFAVQIGLL